SLLPDVPTIAEHGLPGYEAVLRYGLVVPANTPRPIIDRLNKELRAALATDDVRTRFATIGAEPLPSTPEEYAEDIDREETKWSTLIRSLGLKAEFPRARSLPRRGRRWARNVGLDVGRIVDRSNRPMNSLEGGGPGNAVSAGRACVPADLRTTPESSRRFQTESREAPIEPITM